MRLADDAARDGGRRAARRTARRSVVRGRRRHLRRPARPHRRRRAADHRRARPRPAEFSLLAFGGAGPLIAPLLAPRDGDRRGRRARRPVRLLGLGHARRRRRWTTCRARCSRCSTTSTPTGSRRCSPSSRARRRRRCAAQGVAAGDVVLERQIELRYLGQEHALPVPAGDDDRGWRRCARRSRSCTSPATATPWTTALQVLNVRVRGDRPGRAAGDARVPAGRRRPRTGADVAAGGVRLRQPADGRVRRLRPHPPRAGRRADRPGAGRRGHVDDRRATAASASRSTSTATCS